MEYKPLIGKTKSQGWEIGVRRTLHVPASHVWQVLISQPGLSAWLTQDTSIIFAKGVEFKTTDGITARVVGFDPGGLIRLRLHMPQLPHASTMQLRVVDSAKAKTVLAFHHERLEDDRQREAMRQHWTSVLDTLETLL